MTTQKHIQLLFGISEDDYCLMVEAEGYAWLNLDMPACGVDVIKYSRLFWRWWVNEWNIRDAEFIRESKLQSHFEKISPSYLPIAKWSYKSKHDVLHLNIFPNRLVRNEVTKMIKAEVEKEKAKIKQLQEA